MKLKLCIFISLVYTVNISVLQGQIIETNWIRNYGGTNWDENYASLINHKGNLVVAGYSFSNDNDVSSNLGSGDYWIFEIDPSGTIIWESSFGGSATDKCYSIVETTNYEYLICGYTYSLDVDIELFHGNADVFVVKLDSLGNKIWAKNYGGSNYESGQFIKEDLAGNFIIAASSASTDGQVSGHHGGTDNTDIWLFKIDPDGNILWEQSFGSYEDDSPHNIQINNNNLVVAGTAGANGGDVSGHHGWGDVWVFEIDSSGDIIWQNCYGGSESDAIRNIISNNSGHVLSCVTYSNNGDVTGHNGSADA